MGKKQFALLLLVYLNKQIATKQAQMYMGLGTSINGYKLIQTQLNKLTAKNLLSTRKTNNKLTYTLTEDGYNAVSRFAFELCNECLNLHLIQGLYH